MKKKITSTILPLVAVLLGLEIFIRVAVSAGYSLQSDPPSWYSYSDTLGWDRAPSFRGRMECGVRRNFDAEGFREADSEQANDTSSPTVVFLGDSTTMGFCVETEDSFVERIDAMLPEVNAINLGVNGYTSYHGHQVLMEKGPQLRPELIVASFNFNDRRYVLDASQADSRDAFAASAQVSERQRIVQNLERSYVIRALRFALLRIGLIVETSIPRSVQLDTLRTRVTRDEYKRNLTNMVLWARENGSEIVFMVLGDNPARTARLNAGIDYMRAGAYEAALEEFWVVRRDEWFGDLARLYQAEVYRATGRAEEASQVRTARTYWSIHGGRPIVLDTDYNQAMREVATDHGVDIIEAKSVLDRYPGVFIDNAHFDARGHGIAADILINPIRSALGNSGRSEAQSANAR